MLRQRTDTGQQQHLDTSMLPRRKCYTVPRSIHKNASTASRSKSFVLSFVAGIDQDPQLSALFFLAFFFFVSGSGLGIGSFSSAWEAALGPRGGWLDLDFRDLLCSIRS